VSRRLSATPLPWLGGLLVLYLTVPLLFFGLHLIGSHNRGFNTPGLWGALYVSVVTATIATAIIAVVGIPLAYVLARSRGRLSTVVGVLVLLPLAMPPLMGGILLVQLIGPYTALGEAFGRHLTQSMAGVVFAQTFVASPFLVVSARSAFAEVDPAVSEHAATLGHRELSRFFRVSLPMARTGIRAGLALSWLRAFGEYGATVILAYHPYSLPVFTYLQFSSTGIPMTQAPTVLGLGVAAIVAFLGRIPRRRRRATSPIPAPAVPAAARETPIACAIDTVLGDFSLKFEYRSTAPHLAVLGPSGSGKTATLRALAGLLGPGAGSVHYGDRSMDAVAVEDRQIGYVPQGYGLFPHLTVWQQLNFGVGADERLAAHWLERLGLVGLEHRFSDELSGGQRQRVSLAQALARSPDLVLLDEPFSALDSPVRLELRAELRRLQRETGISTVLVTHDPEEAAYLADEIVVLQEGRILQAGSTEEVFSRPASPDVARLLGIRNLCRGRVLWSGTVEVSGTAVSMETGNLPTGTELLWCIRPEEVRIGTDGDLRATVIDGVNLGVSRRILVALGDHFELEAVSSEWSDLAVGSSCSVTLPAASISLWPVRSDASDATTEGSST